MGAGRGHRPARREARHRRDLSRPSGPRRWAIRSPASQEEGEGGGRGRAADRPFICRPPTPAAARPCSAAARPATMPIRAAPTGSARTSGARWARRSPRGHGGFAFSDALKNHGGSWDWDTMSAWLRSPRTFAPGTKMTFAGLSDPQDRADVMLFLNQHGGALTIPPPPAAAPAEGNAAAPAEANGAAPDAGNAAEPQGRGEANTKPAARPPRPRMSGAQRFDGLALAADPLPMREVPLRESSHWPEAVQARLEGRDQPGRVALHRRIVGDRCRAGRPGPRRPGRCRTAAARPHGEADGRCRRRSAGSLRRARSSHGQSGHAGSAREPRRRSRGHPAAAGARDGAEVIAASAARAALGRPARTGRSAI